MHKVKDSQKTYEVRYRLPGEEGRTPRKVQVTARNQSDAAKTAIASIPTAKVIGGAKQLDEGLADFAKRVGKFISRCIGHGCFSYAETPMSAKPGTVKAIRQRATRELAQGAGNKMMQIGGGETNRAKIKFKKKKSKKFKVRKRR